MPLFITAMYHNLGNGWAASVWAFISLGMVSVISSHEQLYRSLTVLLADPDSLPVLPIRQNHPVKVKTSNISITASSISLSSWSLPLSLVYTIALCNALLPTTPLFFHSSPTCNMSSSRTLTIILVIHTIATPSNAHRSVILDACNDRIVRYSSHVLMLSLRLLHRNRSSAI